MLVLLVASLCAWGFNSTARADEPQDTPALVRARERAQLLHQVYTITLDVVHERYFRDDKATIPARALEDVFAEMKRQTKAEAKWIGVNAKTMSIHHEPKDDFEKHAARELGKGAEAVERLDGKLLRRATAIPLSSGCLTCHGTFGIEPKTPRVAGLIIGVPVEE
jgi:hypothetical protein